MTESHDDNWLAFRYVSGEMAGDELSRFESLLAESQPAREAVAAAVLVSQAVTMAANDARLDQADKPTVAAPVRRSPTWGQRMAWATAGAAASLLVAFGLQAWRGAAQNGGGPRGPAPSAHELADLADRWSAAGDVGYQSDDDHGLDEIATSDRNDASGNRDAVEELVAPDWLLAAVSVIPPMPLERHDEQRMPD